MLPKESGNVREYFETPQKYLHKDFGVRIRRNLIFDAVNDFDFSNILDIGCGDGSISIPLLSNKRKLDLCDLSENMLQIAKSNIPGKFSDDVALYNSSLENFSPTKKYDLILAIGLLAHVPDLRRAVALLKDMLSQKGYLIIQFSDYNKLVTRLSLMTRQAHLHSLNKISSKEVFEITRKNNLQIKKQIKFGTILPGMGNLNDNFLYKLCKLSVDSRLLSFYNSEYILILQSNK